MKVALELGRNSVGYEINEKFLEIMKEKIGIKDKLPIFSQDIDIIYRDSKELGSYEVDYKPIIKDVEPRLESNKIKSKLLYHKVVQIINENTLRLDNGQLVRFLGVTIEKKNEMLIYLDSHILGKHILLKNDDQKITNDKEIIDAYVYLKNRIFVNAYLIKSGLCLPDWSINHKYSEKFLNIFLERNGANYGQN
jgi:hypothetical protein